MAGPREERSAVTISLLGGLRIAATGRVLDGETMGRRAQIAVARLAVEAGLPVPRELVAEAVWGEAAPASWRAALRNVMAGARRDLSAAGLEDDVALLAASGGYRLALPPGSSVDVLRLREDTQRAERAADAADDAEAAATARRALAAWHGRPLRGGTEDWVEALRLEVEDLRERLERTLGESVLRLGDAAAAEQVARGLVERSPLREDGHRLLIRALRAAGNRAEALSAYEHCRRLLARELAVAPSAETQALFVELLGEEHHGSTSRRRAGRRTVARRLLRIRDQGPFVGRSAMLALLTRRLELVDRAGMLVVSLHGEAGIGKTRLAAELAGRVDQAHASVLYGRADDRMALPYAALLDAVDADPPDLSGARGAPALIAARLREVGAHGPVLVVLDDMQWASRAELDVLATMLEQSDDVPLLALLLHRSPDDDAVAALGSGARIERLGLDPLSVSEMGEMLTAAGERTGDDAAAARLWRLSGGNPLLASEMLRTGPAVQGAGAPSAVAQLVRARLAALPPGVEDVLRVAAVAGLEFDREVIVATSPAPADDVRAWLAIAIRDGLLASSVESERSLAFRHELVRDALLASLAPAERLRLHARLAAALDPEPGGAVWASLAYHLAAAGPEGDWRRTLRYAHPAARAAFAAGVFEDVAALASRTVSALEQARDPDVDARLDLQILLGGALQALGDPRAEPVLRRVIEEAAARRDPVRIADAALAFSHTGSVSEEMYNDHRLLPVYEHALGAQPDEELRRRALLLSRMASGRAWGESADASRRTADEALALARAEGDRGTLAAVLTAARRALASVIDPGRRDGHERELFELADELDDPGLRVNAALWRFETDILQGRGDRLAELLHDAAAHARGLRPGSFHHSIAYQQAALALLRGRVSDAEGLVEAAATIARDRRLAPAPVEGIRVVQLMLVRGEQGRLPELRDEAAALYEPSGLPAWIAIVAAIDLAAGRTEGTAERVDAMLDAYAAQGSTAIGPTGLLVLMAASVVRLGDPDRARRVREMIAPYGGLGAFVVGFAGPVDYHLGLLDRFLGDEAGARERFTEAAAFCARLGAPSWEARCRAAADPE